MSAPWFRVPRPRPAASVRLFVFHHAGGSGSSYFRWSELLPEYFELVVSEMPGRGVRHREPLVDELSVLLPEMAQAILPLLDRPAIFFGHSLGALTAFELHRFLFTKHKNSVAAVRGLGLSSFLPPTSENLSARISISHLPDAEFVRALENYAPLPSELRFDAAAQGFFLPVIRNDIRLIENYRPPSAGFDDGRTYSRTEGVGGKARALIFAGQDDTAVSIDKLRQWADLVAMEGDVRVFPGGHFHVFQRAGAIIGELLRTFG